MSDPDSVMENIEGSADDYPEDADPDIEWE
jgi:hypothetical protein